MTSEETSLSLVWLENFGSGTFTDRTHVNPSRLSSPVRSTFSFFATPLSFGILVDDPRQRCPEAGEMRAAVALRDVVGEAQHVLVVAVVPPQRDLDRDAVLLPRSDQIGSPISGDAVAVEVAHERSDAAIVAHGLGLDVGVAFVAQRDVGARVQERQLPQAVLERREVELDLGEGVRARQER